MKQLKKTKEDWLRMNMKEEMERIRDSAMPVDLFSSEDKEMLLKWRVELNGLEVVDPRLATMGV